MIFQYKFIDGFYIPFISDGTINRTSLIWIMVPILIFLQSSCAKLVEVTPPPTSVTDGSVFNSDATASAVLTGVFTKMSGANFTAFDVSATSFWTGLSADELTLWSGANDVKQFSYYNNQLSTIPSLESGSEFWYTIYGNIFSCNAAIEGINNAKNLTPTLKQQLLGESRFLRAFFYFYLVNLYGDVPLILSTDYKENAHKPRSSKGFVYQAIITDLKDAQGLLSDQYLKGDALTSYITGLEERVRPTKWAAIAMLARTYLYSNDWVQAEAMATLIIGNSSYYRMTALNDVFIRNSTEAIWQLQPVTSGDVTNTQDAKLFILPSTGPNSSSNPAYLSTTFLNSFEDNDQRKFNWVDSMSIGGNTFYFPYKYKVNLPNAPVTEYLMMLRLGEQYLIRAEARAQQNNITGAQDDLDVIRNRAGLLNTTANDKFSLLAAILHERQVELFTELGHRWMDLKRTGAVDSVMEVVTPQKGGAWRGSSKLYPIPLGDILKNSDLVQNIGY